MTSSLSAQDTANPAAGAYTQPAPGVALSGVVQYRDTALTAQVATSTAAPSAAAVVATVTPGVAGRWEVSGTISISGTTVAAADTNNMGLYVTSTAILAAIPIGVNSTTGTPGAIPFGPVVVTLTAANTVNIKAIGNATGSSIYGAQICCRRIQ